MNELMELGFSENESKIYVELLRLKNCSAGEISKRLGLPRTTIYDSLDSLLSSGLISKVIENKKQRFIANDPAILFQQQKERELVVQGVVKNLTEIRGSFNEVPVAEVHKGKIAVAKILSEIVFNSDLVLIIGSESNAIKFLGHHPLSFRAKKLGRNLKVREILEDSKESRKLSQDRNTSVRILKSLNKSNEATFITEDSVYNLIIHHDIFGIKIHSKEHVNAMKLYFEELWKISTPI